MQTNKFTYYLPTITAFCVIMFAMMVAVGARFLVTSEKSITAGCEAEFCVGQDTQTVDALLVADTDEVYEQTLKSKPFDVLSVSSATVQNGETMEYDRFDYWHVMLKKDRGWEKHIRLKFKNNVLIEIDIKSYGPLAVS